MFILIYQESYLPFLSYRETYYLDSNLTYPPYSE